MRKIKNFTETEKFAELNRDRRLATGVRNLEIGDALEVPAARWSSMRATAHQIAKRTGRKFQVRKNGECVYVWRIS